MSLAKIWPCLNAHGVVFAVFLPVSQDEFQSYLERDMALTAAYLSSNVDGSMLGKSLSATGRRSSMKGTIRNTEKGTNRSRSCVVRFNWKKTISWGKRL